MPTTAPPRIWLCVSDRQGDNGQAEVLAEALGQPFERKRILFARPWDVAKPIVRPTLDYVDAERSDVLEPPWPDLLITIGRRLSCVALWVRERSSGRTRVVLLGKPSGMLEHFDLVVPSAENPLPARPNVLPVDLPLMNVDADAIAAEGARWSSLARLPRPLTAVLVGGPTKPFRFDGAHAEELAARLGRDLGREGTLFFVTSPRTTPAVLDSLRRGLPENAQLVPWRRGDPENPYLGLLAHADRFVVTADSISMQVEVARLGRPLAIYPLDVQKKSWRARLRYRLADRLLTKSSRDRHPIRSEPLGDALYRRGVIRFERDFGAIHRALFRRGAAVPYGAPFPSAGSPVPNELDEVLASIGRLLDPQYDLAASAAGGTVGQE